MLVEIIRVGVLRGFGGSRSSCGQVDTNETSIGLYGRIYLI